jgi:aminopeptidase-like protein
MRRHVIASPDTAARAGYSHKGMQLRADTVPQPPGGGGRAMKELSHLIAGLDAAAVGSRMYGLIRELFPICRSITGAGLRRTLGRVGAEIPLEIHEVPTGSNVFDWVIPKEWNIYDAWIKDPTGNKVVDFRESNLHVVNYSVPVHRKMGLAELRNHLHSLPEQPDLIPYRTTYYKETWGFCLSHRQLSELRDGEYEICINSQLAHGALTYGECRIIGKSDEEFLLSCHVCHPSLCNDNLSGLALVTELARLLLNADLNYSYRVLFIPGTIGSIAWLARNEHLVSRIRHGLVVACVGDPGKFHYKRTRRGDAPIDRAALHALRHCGWEFEVLDFSPYGYDERQYCSPGFNLPVGSLTRTPHGRYAEYHTSGDNLDFVRPDALGASLTVYLSLIGILEANGRFVNLNPKCEPQLGRRGLYRPIGGLADDGASERGMLWVLNLSDGDHSLLDIAERAQLPFSEIQHAALTLARHGLVREATPGDFGATLETRND